MNIKNFKKLRDFIASLPAKACNMKDWMDYARNKETGHLFTLEEMKERKFACGTAGCLGGWGTVLIQASPQLKRRYKTVGQFLGIEGLERELLFFDFPNDSSRGWKDWMLRRLDGIIEDKEIQSYRIQMDRRRKNNE